MKLTERLQLRDRFYQEIQNVGDDEDHLTTEQLRSAANACLEVVERFVYNGLSMTRPEPKKKES